MWLWAMRRKGSVKIDGERMRIMALSLFEIRCWTICFGPFLGVPIWTLYEIIYFRAIDTGLSPTFQFSDNPIWFVIFFCNFALERVSFLLGSSVFTLAPLLSYCPGAHHRNMLPTMEWAVDAPPRTHLFFRSINSFGRPIPSDAFFISCLCSGIKPSVFIGL